MNKQLLSFTALVAVGLLGVTGTAVAQKKMKASKPTISLGGYTTQGLRYVDNADAVGGRDTGGLGVFRDSEIFFNIKGQLDNGIKIGGRWELEGDSADATVDEHEIYLRGSFGELRLGADDGAAQLMVLGYQGSWATSVGLNLNFDVDELVPEPAGFNLRRTGVRLDGNDSDNNKITYISPRFGGFQIGASYARDVGSTLNADGEIDQTAGANTGENWYSIAANFDRKFGNFRIGIALGYVQEDSAFGALASKDPKEYGGGILLETGPFRIAAGYKTTDDYFSSATVSNEGDFFDIGVRYTFGAHKIGLAYYYNDTDAGTATAGDDEVDVLWLTHAMTLGPGVTWKNTLAWVDWDGEGTAATADNDGWGAATTIALNF